MALALVSHAITMAPLCLVDRGFLRYCEPTAVCCKLLYGTTSTQLLQAGCINVACQVASRQYV